VADGYQIVRIFDMRFKPVASMAACVFALSSIAVLRAEEYKLPENPTVKSLVEFCKKVERTDPQSEAEAKDLKTKGRPALKQACQQIITLEKSDSTPDGRYARRLLLIFELQ